MKADQGTHIAMTVSIHEYVAKTNTQDAAKDLCKNKFVSITVVLCLRVAMLFRKNPHSYSALTLH